MGETAEAAAGAASSFAVACRRNSQSQNAPNSAVVAEQTKPRGRRGGAMRAPRAPPALMKTNTRMPRPAERGNKSCLCAPLCARAAPAAPAGCCQANWWQEEFHELGSCSLARSLAFSLARSRARLTRLGRAKTRLHKQKATRAPESKLLLKQRRRRKRPKQTIARGGACGEAG